MRYDIRWPIFGIGIALGSAFWIRSRKSAGAQPRPVTADGFSTASGPPWIDAGVWLANRLTKDKVTLTTDEAQFIKTVFTELGVDDSGIIRYRPNPDIVRQVLFTDNISQKVQQIVLDFINLADKLPGKVLV